MPFVSVIVIAAFVYIGMTGQLVGLAEILAAISSFALLLVNIAVLLKLSLNGKTNVGLGKPRYKED